MKSTRKVLFVQIYILVFSIVIGCSDVFHSRESPAISLTRTDEPSGLANLPIVITSTLELTITPSAIPFPILSPNGAKESLTLFVQTNGNCKLPCLMGLTPGHGSQEIEVFSNYFISNSQQSINQMNSMDVSGYLDDKKGGALLVFWENKVRVQISLGAVAAHQKEQIDHVQFSGSVYKHDEDTNGNEIAILLLQHPYYDYLLGSFSLHRILTEYGEPAEVWIMPFPVDNGYSYDSGAYPFVFLLLYKDKGFAVEYISRVVEEAEYLTGCPNVDYVHISTWNPEENKGLTDIAKYFSGTDSLSEANAAFFRPLQEVTSLGVREFYNIYKVSGANSCIQTPKRLWP